MDSRKQPIGIELVRRGIVTQEDIEKAIDYQKSNPRKKIGDILHILKLCDSQALITAVGEILGEKVILITNNDIKVRIEDYISLDLAKQNKAIPFEIAEGKVKVCFADTTNRRSVEVIRLLLLNKGLIMEKYIAFESDIDRVLKSFEGTVTDNFNSSSDITGLVDSIIKTGMNKRASDIHFEPMEDELRIRYRIDGELFTTAHIEKEKQGQIIGRLKAISNMF